MVATEQMRVPWAAIVTYQGVASQHDCGVSFLRRHAI